jgi:hemolysin activation/secretion protein
MQGAVQNLAYDFFISRPLSAPPFFRPLSTQVGLSLNASF